MIPLDVNKILAPALVRITNDQTLKQLLSGTVKAVKGPRRPSNTTGNYFTVYVLANNSDPDSKVHNGTLLICFYCPNYSTGNANVELMGPVTARVAELFDDALLAMEGYNNFNLVVEEPLGPLFDPAYPGESFMTVRIRFNVIKKGSV